MKPISFINKPKGERDMARRYSKKVYIDGFCGQVVRTIKDDNNTITHLDVEIDGVIDRYPIQALQAPLEPKKDE